MNQQKRKLSWRKVFLALFTVVLVGLSAFAMLSAARIQDNRHIRGLDVQVENEEQFRFVNKEQVVRQLFTDRHLKVQGLSLGKADLNQMERILSTNPWIGNAEVFLDNARILHIHITQRVPQLRLFTRKGASFYMDASLALLPVSEEHTQYELLFVNVPDLGSDSISSEYKKSMLFVARAIKRDSFWQAQTSEIIVNGLNDFEIVPVLGTHKILLGSPDRLEEKLENVFAFYQDVLNKVGWNRYTLLDARFADQIVASPSLPWKAPVDRALTNMNWVQTIVGDVSKTEATAINIAQDTIKTSRQ